MDFGQSIIDHKSVDPLVGGGRLKVCSSSAAYIRALRNVMANMADFACIIMPSVRGSMAGGGCLQAFDRASKSEATVRRL
jgi:hypothetical protein